MERNKLQEWYSDALGEQREVRVKKVFENWYKRNLVITRGSGRTAEEIFGLPYTSTSSFAALWNCQAKAHYKDNENYYFEYLAIADNFDIIVGLVNKDDEDDIKEIWIGCCIM